MQEPEAVISKLALSLILFAGVASTSFADPPAITEFKFETQYNAGIITDDIVADIYGDTLIVGIIPFQLSDFSLKATFVTSGESVKVNGADQQSTITLNDFSSPVSYLVSTGEEARTYKVALVYTGLPLVYLYTHDATPIVSKDDYVSGTMKIYPNVDTLDTYTGAIQIRGRGNTTWTLPKKPYRVKLGTAASILGMPSDKDWVLLANYSDKSLMRNSLAYYLGSKMNLEYTPRMTHVDVVLNGVYQGNYLMGEHVKVDKDRVDIKELDEEDIDEEVITGGYFLELDDYRDGLYFELASGLPFVIKDPEDLPQEQLDYIKNYMQETENAIFSEERGDPDLGYAKYINIDTFIEWYWLMELFKNIDAQDVSSIFYYKDRGEKLNMGPLWDLDVAAGNASVNTGDDPTSFYVRESKWFKKLFEDPVFKQTAEARWFTFKEELLASLPDVIDAYAGNLDISQRLNFYKWDILNQPIWPSTLVLGSYENEVDYLKQWLSTRIEWIDAQIPPQEVIGVPQLHSPSINTTVETLSPTIQWFRANLAESYDVQISATDNFETLIVDRTGLSDTAYSITEQLASQTRYYWRTRAVNVNDQSAWSETWSFTTPLILGTGENAHRVAMFPNPTSKELFIETPLAAGVDRAELVDALGRIAVSSVIVPGATTKLDVGNLQRGMYVIILRGSVETPITKKVILH